MRDQVCVAFLKWALPRMGMRWAGFRRVHRQVCKRLRHRLRELGVTDCDAYRRVLEHAPSEWVRLEHLCRVTVSRLARDRSVFAYLGTRVFPALAEAVRSRGDGVVRCWSVGCACGEEAYSLILAWQSCCTRTFPTVTPEVLGTDIDPAALARARKACYPRGSLREVPEGWWQYFRPANGSWCLGREYVGQVAFALQDFRRELPGGRFDLVLCRNLAFTYYDEGVQRELLERLVSRLRMGGALVIGKDEAIPGPTTERLVPWYGALGIYRLGTGA